MAYSEIQNNGMTSLQAIAEVLFEKLVPQGGEGPYVELENILEVVRNEYTGILWQAYMNSFADGDRSAIGQLLNRKQFPVAPSISTEEIIIASLARDAGLSQIIAVDKDGKIVGDPYVRSTSNRFSSKPELLKGYRYYSIGEEVFFPDGHDKCTTGLELVYMGLPDSDYQRVPRDMAALTMKSAWGILSPGREIPADITNNENPNG